MIGLAASSLGFAFARKLGLACVAVLVLKHQDHHLRQICYLAMHDLVPHPCAVQMLLW